MKTVWGLPFYCVYTEPTEDSSSIAFERHFNPSLKYDSEYFGNLSQMIACVERNASEATTPE